VASDLGFSETVFVDDRERGTLRIFTPTTELDFAGHPTVGTAWLIAREQGPIATLRAPAGEVTVRYAGDDVFVAAQADWGPPFEHVELGSAAAVDALTGPPNGGDRAAAWAWVDEPGGIVRSRVFPIAYGISEDEATGAAALRLCALLGRPIEVRQGRGSIIRARPLRDGRVEVGGRVVLDELRDYAPGGLGAGTRSQ
jgi:predicted PhzF superfamily epimerase YddE/YHI9